MPHTRSNPEILLKNAEAQAGRSVRIARQCLGKPALLDAQRVLWRRLSNSMAALAPVMLVLVIAGSLVQTNSALIETIWEITAAAILLAGVLIAFADSRSFYLKPIDNSSATREELLQLENRSAQARAWHDIVRAEGRALHQFDLEIMWALAALDHPPGEAKH